MPRKIPDNIAQKLVHFQDNYDYVTQLASTDPGMKNVRDFYLTVMILDYINSKAQYFIDEYFSVPVEKRPLLSRKRTIHLGNDIVSHAFINNPGVEVIKYEEFDNKENNEAYERFLKIRKSGKTPLMGLRLTPDISHFLDVVYHGYQPVFFKSKASNSIVFKSAFNFFKEFQASDTYIMPAYVKDRQDIKTDIKNRDARYNLEFYPKTSKDNIGVVHAVIIDIDIHDDTNPATQGELQQLGEALDAFIDYQRLPITPTFIINTGRGLQLYYVLEEPIYRNSPKIDFLLRKFQKTIAQQLNSEILPNISMRNLRVDNNIGAISQKGRLPGTINLRSFTRAYILKDNSDVLYHMSDTLDEILGMYEPEYTYEQVLKKKNEKKDSSLGNNGNGRGNLAAMLKRRIDDITNAMIAASNINPHGFRNNGYLTLATQFFNLNEVLGQRPDYGLEKHIISIEEKLSRPYFKKETHIKPFIESALGSYSRFRSKHLTNEAIENYCLALDMVKKDSETEFSFSIFFKEKKEVKREKSKLKNINKRLKLKEKLVKLYRSNFNLSKFSKDNKVSRTTVYRIIREIKEVRQKLIEKLIADKKNNIGRPSRKISRKPPIILPFITEKLNNVTKIINRPLDSMT